MDIRSRGGQHAIVAEFRDGVLDDFGVDFVESLFHLARANRAIGEKRLHRRPALGAERVLHLAVVRRRRGGDEGVRRVTWMESASEVLRREEMQVIFDRENGGFTMQVVDGSSCVSAGDEAKGLVLDKL